MTGRGPVVAGVDGSADAVDAVRWAAAQAGMWHCPLRLVHAHTPVWRPRSALAIPPSTDDERASLELGREWLRDAAQVAAAVAPGVEVGAELVTAPAATLLADESARARLVVVGSRGLGGFTGLLLGSTAIRLAAHARSPVAVVRGSDAGTGTAASGPVVLGVDGSPVGEAAIAFAYEAASTRRAPLLAVHAWSDVSIAESFVPRPPTFPWPIVEDDERRLLAQRLAGWQERYPDVEVRQVVAEARPAHTLLQASDGAQLLVVGSHGRGGLRGLLLGSTSHALLHHATCPVVVARADVESGE